MIWFILNIPLLPEPDLFSFFDLDWQRTPDFQHCLYFSFEIFFKKNDLKNKTIAC